MLSLHQYEYNSATKDSKSIKDIFSSYENSVEKWKHHDLLKAKIINTPIGSVIAVSNDTHLLLLSFVNSKHLDGNIKHLMKIESKVIVEADDAAPIKLLEKELNAYFKGELSKFEIPFLIQPIETEFQQNVWRKIHEIEFGETTTYAQLAEKIGSPKSFRAVANACGRNPFVIMIPCHRIVKTGGDIGGYTTGCERKGFLLNHEKQMMKY